MRILADNKTSNYRIVIAEGANEAGRYAATELSKYIAAISGAALPVVTDDTAPVETEIVIGNTSRAGAPCSKDLKNDGFILKTVGERLFILGANDRGNIYGVYCLLEDVLGCRFLTHNVEKIPTRTTLSLKDLDNTKIPPLEYRETFWHEPQTYPDLAMKRGFNGSITTRFSPYHGGGIEYWGFAHTMFSYVSPDDYYDTHPEYFSMIDGKRTREYTQLCLTNPEVLEITKKKLRQNIIDHPECKIFSLTQMDWYNPCTCPECAKVDEEEGAHSGTMLRFVNACANSIAQEFPGVIIDTFAYQFTRQAPKITRPAPNVCVRICSIECCFSHPLNECDEIVFPFKKLVIGDATFQKDLRNWHKICDRIFVWDYTTNYRFYLAPFPNLHVLQSNMKFFLENGVTGIFEQGNAQAISGEFGELRMYIISKLMWNPDVDVDQVMDEFLTGYYGLAGAPIKEYIKLLADHMVNDHVHLGIYDDPTWYVPAELLGKAEKLWDEAEAVARDENELGRIQRSRLQLRYAKVQRMDTSDPARAQLVEDLIADIRKYGFAFIRESQDLEKSFEILRAGGPYR